MKQLITILAAIGAALTLQTAVAADVKITPLGGVDGEFCILDRAMVFEDPDGTRILYDPGFTVAGAQDPRLAKIDAVLISHMHFDHGSGRHTKAPNASLCTKPEMSVDALPETNAVRIDFAKGAKIVTGSEMSPFFAAKLKSLGGNPKDSILARFGATKMIGGDLGKAMKAAGIGGYVGQATGYILRFTNGLVAYLSGDTGMTAEQDKVVRGFYHAELVIMNIDDTYTTGPKEAAFVINEMIKPASVIPSHANEPATKGGKVRAGTRTDIFQKAVKVPVHIPPSGKTMALNGGGVCTSGC